MPLQCLEFRSPPKINTFISNLIERKIFIENKLFEEFIVDTDGNTYPVSEILALSDEECEQYKGIRFCAHTKEKPENDNDFVIYSLEEFRASPNKKLFVYNKMLAEALLASDNGRIIKGKRRNYQDVSIAKINTKDPISHDDYIIFPVITPYSNSYEILPLLKNIKSNLGNKITDPSTYFSGYLPLDKIVFNKALFSLIMVNQQNYIKNQGKFLLKLIENEKNKSAAIQEAREKLEEHINALQIETKKTIKIDYEELLQHKKTLEEKKNQFAAAKSLLRKYSQRNLEDYENLKKDLEEKHHFNRNEYNNLNYRFYTTLLILMIMMVSLFIVAPVGAVVGLDPGIPVALVLTFGVVFVCSFPATSSKLLKYDEAASETLKLLDDIEEINKLQKTIDLTERYKNLCERISQYINPLDPIQELKNAIPKGLQENNIAPTPSPAVLSSNVLSSSEYLFRKGGINPQRNKTSKEKKSRFTNDEQEKNVKRKDEETDKITLEMDEVHQGEHETVSLLESQHP